MKTRFFLFFLLAISVGRVIAAQAPVNNDAEALRVAAERREAAARFARLRAVAMRTAYPPPRNNQGALRPHPSLNEQDLKAIAPPDEDLKTYAAFLKAPKTGILRLQNADICTPNNLIVQAAVPCPNNVKGKGTAYSFRAGDYRLPPFADISFAGKEFIDSGSLTIGVFSDLGDTEIDKTNLASDGVAQLAKFQPPGTGDEFGRQLSILNRGLQIGQHVYRTRTAVAAGHTYVLRSVVYNGKVIRGKSPSTSVSFEADDRKDILMVFKVLRVLDDGSVVLLWKQLKKVDSPHITVNIGQGPPKTEKTVKEIKK